MSDDAQQDDNERTYMPLEANNGMMLVVVTEGSKHIGAYTDGMLMQALDQIADQLEANAKQDDADKLRAASTLLWYFLSDDEEEE
jgi:hypothetical protein